MKKKYFIQIFIFFILLHSGCQKESNCPTCNLEDLPELITVEVESITNTSAICGGQIISKGGTEIIRRGVCWSLSPSPTIDDLRTYTESDSIIYKLELNGLLPSTTYYVRSYATNCSGTGYGNEISFKTNGDIPTLTTILSDQNTMTSVTCGGEISSDGGDMIIERGICWNTNPEPSVTDNKVIMGSGIGSYSGTINGLTTNTKYYLRAYAENSAGIAYGNEVSIVLWLNEPSESITDIDGNVYQTIKIGTQIWMKENLKVIHFNDGSELLKLYSASSIADKNSEGFYVNADSSLYGYIYNGFVTESNKNVCPGGWHVPSESEWDELVTFLGGSGVAGGRLKEASLNYWAPPNTGADNLSGFTALPNGYRGFNGFPHDIYLDGHFMTSTTNYEDNPIMAGVIHNGTNTYKGTNSSKVTGASIRCLKDE